MPFLTKGPEEEPRSTTPKHNKLATGQASWLRGREVPYGPRKTNWKFIVIILILAILVGGGILGYFKYFQKEITSLTKFPEIKKPEKIVKDETAKPVPSEVKGWKTYRNEKYGFEVKYPPEWVIKGEEFMIPILHLEKKEGKKDEKEIVEIEITEQKDNVSSLEEFFNAKMKKSKLSKDAELKEIYIAGEKGYELIEKVCTRYCVGAPYDVYSTFVYIYFFHNDKIYQIAYSEAISGVGWKEDIKDYNYYDEFKKIVSTFKFIEKAPESKISPKIPLSADFCSIESLSPDGKYLVVDCGTSPIRSKSIFNNATKEELANFNTCAGGNYAWMNNEEIVFLEYQMPSPLRPYGEGGGCGIALISIKENKKKILQKTTGLKDYRDIKILEDSNIQFTLVEVSSPEDWEEEGKEKITHWIMDKNGNIIRQVFEPE